MKKGFFFSIDTALASIIVTILIFGIFFNLLKTQEDVFGNVYLSKLANDVLITLNKNKTLDTLNETLIKTRLNDILPNNLAYKLNITVYECSGQNCNDFVVVGSKNIFIVEPNVTEEDFVISKRIFLTFQDRRIKYFSIADLRLWSI